MKRMALPITHQTNFMIFWNKYGFKMAAMYSDHHDQLSIKHNWIFIDLLNFWYGKHIIHSPKHILMHFTFNSNFYKICILNVFLMTNIGILFWTLIQNYAGIPSIFFVTFWKAILAVNPKYSCVLKKKYMRSSMIE